MQTQKLCVVGVCGNEKSSLVHKFPSDHEKFKKWMEIINSNKLKGLTEEQIKKRFFVCSRHFRECDYKNIESRSLNSTAIPSLNIHSLNKIHLSKAGKAALQTGLNSTFAVASTSDVLNISAAHQTYSKPVKRPHSTEDSSPAKYQKLTIEQLPPKQEYSYDLLEQESTEIMLVPSNLNKMDKFEIIETPNLQTSPDLDLKEENLTFIEDVKSTATTNKLLAVFELTPELYEKFNAKLLKSDKNEQIDEFLNLFHDDNDNLSTSDNEINLVLADDQVLNLDLFWLRDHCRCETCYDHANHQRKISILEIPNDITASQYVFENDKLSVVWNDNHKSNYDLIFLLKNQLKNDQQAPKTELCLWNASELSEKLNSSLIVPLNSYMNDPDPVLKNLYQYGVAFIDGVKPTQQNTEFVVRQLFPIHKTFFGEMWTFSDNKDHSDTAYTNEFLGPHNDGTYFNSAPGLQVLHCIQHSGTGGESLLIDGFYVCAKLKRENPDVFERLCKTIVPGEYIEDGRHHTYYAPIINVDPLTGQLIQIRYNLYDRAPFNTVSIKNIRQFYSDLKCLTKEMEDPLNQHYYKLIPGTVMIFDNWRILHGRQVYTGKRTMTGCYVERTEFQSAVRSNGIID